MHGEGLSVAVAVVEVADVAWAALERRHDKSRDAVARDKEFSEAEGALEQEREENRRLRARLEEYQKALEDMQVRGEQDDTSEVGSCSESGGNADHHDVWIFSRL